MELSTTDIVSNTIVNETTKRGLNLVLAKEIVFRCYIQRIAMNKHRYNPQFPKISDFSPENYKVWFFKKLTTLIIQFIQHGKILKSIVLYVLAN